MKFLDGDKVTIQTTIEGGSFGGRCDRIELDEADVRRLLTILECGSAVRLTRLADWLNCSVLTRFKPAPVTKQ